MAGILFIISAPSGSGKSTLVNEVRKQLTGIEFSVSWTTRLPRGSEQNGREYCFTTREKFEQMVAAGQFGHAEVFGNYYGTPRSSLEEAQREGHDLVLVPSVIPGSQFHGQRRTLPWIYLTCKVRTLKRCRSRCWILLFRLNRCGCGFRREHFPGAGTFLFSRFRYSPLFWCQPRVEEFLALAKTYAIDSGRAARRVALTVGICGVKVATTVAGAVGLFHHFEGDFAWL